MNSTLWLKLQTRKLIDRCGGLDEASRACGELARPYSAKQLSRCQLPNDPNLLPIDIVAALEAYCGDPVVSRAMVEARPATLAVGDLRDEASEVTERAAALQRHVREALADDGQISPREAGEIAQAVEAVMDDLRDVAAALAAASGRGRPSR